MPQGTGVQATPAPAAAQLELNALTAQRAELRDQLRMLASRRNQLDEQTHVTSDAAAKQRLQARMAEIDERTARIDGQIQALDDRISAGIARTAAAVEGQPGQPAVPPIPAIPPIPPVPAFGEFPGFGAFPGQQPQYFTVTAQQMAGALIGEAAVFILLGVVFWRLGWKRMRNQLTQMSAAQGTQLDRVQQAVDVIAVEVERISENQRFVSKLLNERALGAGPAEPVSQTPKKSEASPVMHEQR